MSDPKTGPGSTSDPNQANRTGDPKQPATGIPDKAPTTPPSNDDPAKGPGTTEDPNQANRT